MKNKHPYKYNSLSHSPYSLIYQGEASPFEGKHSSLDEVVCPYSNPSPSIYRLGSVRVRGSFSLSSPCFLLLAVPPGEEQYGARFPRLVE
jgi:hypothetical protein